MNLRMAKELLNERTTVIEKIDGNRSHNIYLLYKLYIYIYIT